MKNIWSFLSFVVLMIILLVDLSSKFSTAGTTATAKVINVQEVNLVDKEGRKCASFFVNGTGEASLELGPTKQKGFVTSVVSANGIAFYKSDGDGHGVSQCYLGAESGAMTDKHGKTLWTIPQ